MRLSTLTAQLIGPLLLSATGPSVAAPQTTEIVVIAGNHGLPLTRGYGPTELRALLSKIAPDAVGIENFPEWQEAGVQFHPWLPEPAVAMSWAEGADADVYGVKNGDNVPGWQSQAQGLRRLRDSTSAARRAQTYLNGLRRLISGQARMVFEHDEAITWLHSPAGVARRAQDRERYTEDQRNWMRAQDDTIAMGIITLVRTHRPRRLAVILGSDHYGPTSTRLENQPDIRVLSTEAFLPLTVEELREAWAPFDAEMILAANLDHPIARAAPHTRDHARTRAELERLVAYAPDSAPTRYHLGRWHMLFDRRAQAETLLVQVRTGVPGADVRLPAALSVTRSPPLPTYRSLATFALATLYDLNGSHDPARRLYEELLALSPVDLQPRTAETTAVDLRAYLDSLIASPYVGGAEEYGRMLDARRPLFWRDSPEPIPSLATRRGGVMTPPPGRR